MNVNVCNAFLYLIVVVQSHMAMFFLYKLLRDGVTVVYEKSSFSRPLENAG